MTSAKTIITKGIAFSQLIVTLLELFVGYITFATWKTCILQIVNFKQNSQILLEL